MKTVYSAANIALVSIFQSMLEERGIKCWIKNESLLTGIGEIPPIETWPQLCVEDNNYSEAKRIVDEALAAKDVATAWKCASCGEIIEGQFTECWNCGKSRLKSGHVIEARLTNEHPYLSKRDKRSQTTSIRALRIFLLIMSALIFLLANLPLRPGQSDVKKALLSLAALLLGALIFTYFPTRSENDK